MTLHRKINTATLLSTLAATAVTILASQHASAQADYTVLLGILPHA